MIKFLQTTFKTRISLQVVMRCKLNKQDRLIALPSILLTQFSNLLTNTFELASNPILREFKYFLLPNKMKPSFMELVESKSNLNRAELFINRQKALALRNGQSDNFNDSMIS
jgi:hypothetical protein